MNTDDEEVNLTAWRQLYQAAVLGLDPTKIRDRIEEAEKAIAKRALAVMREGADGAEREALADAMQALSDLKRHLSKVPTVGLNRKKKTYAPPKLETHCRKHPHIAPLGCRLLVGSSAGRGSYA